MSKRAVPALALIAQKTCTTDEPRFAPAHWLGTLSLGK
jgi:hypothetical protein